MHFYLLLPIVLCFVCLSGRNNIMSGEREIEKKRRRERRELLKLFIHSCLLTIKCRARYFYNSTDIVKKVSEVGKGGFWQSLSFVFQISYSVYNLGRANRVCRYESDGYICIRYLYISYNFKRVCRLLTI